MAAESSERFGVTGILELTGKIIVLVILLLLFIIVFVFCLYKYFWYRHREYTTSHSDLIRHHRRRLRLDSSTGHQEELADSRRGLEPSVLKTLPVIIFDPKEFKLWLDCAICLTEISQGEKVRLLHQCDHGFHVGCIDMWFESHSTCPLCRSTVGHSNRSETGHGPPSISITIQIPQVDGHNFRTEAPNISTNVLFWGDQTRVGTFATSVEENSHNNVVLGQSLSPISR